MSANRNLLDRLDGAALIAHAAGDQHHQVELLRATAQLIRDLQASGAITPAQRASVRAARFELIDKGCEKAATTLDWALSSPTPESKEAESWATYVAGVVVAYLGGPVDDERIKPIAGIIARRLWAIPKADAPAADRVQAIADRADIESRCDVRIRQLTDQHAEEVQRLNEKLAEQRAATTEWMGKALRQAPVAEPVAREYPTLNRAEIMSDLGIVEAWRELGVTWDEAIRLVRATEHALDKKRGTPEQKLRSACGMECVHCIVDGRCHKADASRPPAPEEGKDAARQTAHSDKNVQFADWMLHGIEISGEAADGFKLNAAVRDVLVERQRQISVEGWTPDHDDAHAAGELVAAGCCYAMFGGRAAVPNAWPWAATWWKPKSPRRNFVRAGALILAEIERLDRAAGVPGAGA